MKTKSILLAFLLCASVAFGQKAKIAAAYNYLKYEELDKAKEAIDQAAIDDGSMGIDKTWYYRGLIYEQIYNSDKFKYLSPNAIEIAFQGYKKALTIDPNSEFKDDINTRLKYLRVDFHNKAVEDYRNKDYTSALNNFEYELKITPDDSTANLYAAYSAERGKNAAKAIEYYQKIITHKYDDPAIYHNIATLYKQQRDTDRALFELKEGRKKYPDDLDLMLSEINIYLPQGKDKEAIDVLNAAIQKDPKNASLYFALGTTYDGLANAKDAAGNNVAKPDDRKDLLSKATDNYKKAIEDSANYFEANYNLGALYFNQAAEMLLTINQIKDAKEYAAAKEKCEAVFAQSQPYLEKALEISPNDHDTLFSLKQLYFRQNNMDKYYRVKDKLDAMGK